MADIMQLTAGTLSRIPADNGIAVALSGGADSVALAVALAEAVAYENKNRPLTLLHCNFHLRKSESDRDADFAADIAKRLDLPFLSVDFHDVTEIAARDKESIEMVCRRLRYEWFDRVLADMPYTAWLALGHHCEDNRETIFLNLFRGTGSRGLCGMDEFDSKRRFIKPLLNVSRSEIESFLQSRHIPWIVDSSNLIPDVKRNILRLSVIPVIERQFPSAMRGIDTTASNLADDYAILYQALQETIDKIRVPSSTNTYDLQLLESLSASPRRVIFEIVRKFGFNSSQAENMAYAVSGSEAKQFYSASHSASIHRGHLVISALNDSENIFLQADNPFTLAEMSGEFSCEKIYISSNDDPIAFIMKLADSNCRFFAMDASVPLPSVWTWRSTQTGDRIAPFGMNGRTRLVSDILSDVHASPIQKKQARLLVADDTPVWIAPWRASGFRPVRRTSHEILLFQLIEDGHSCKGC